MNIKLCMKAIGGYPIVSIFKGLNVIVNEALFNFEENGLTIRAVDPANISMVEIEAPPTAFDVYTIDEGVKIGLDVDRIIDFLKIAKKRDTIEIEYEKEKKQFKVRVGNIQYQTSIIPPENIKEPKTPNLQFDVKVTIDAGEFKRAIQCISKVKSESVIFRCDDIGLTIEANTDIDRIEFTISEIEAIEFNKGNAKSVYSMEYLKDLTKIAEKGDTVTIEFGNDLPLSLTYSIDEKVTIRYFLAPRIEAEI